MRPSEAGPMLAKGHHESSARVAVSLCWMPPHAMMFLAQASGRANWLPLLLIDCVSTMLC